MLLIDDMKADISGMVRVGMVGAVNVAGVARSSHSRTCSLTYFITHLFTQDGWAIRPTSESTYH